MKLLPPSLALAALLAGAPALRAQESQIEVLAPILAAADARDWKEAALQRGLTFPDSTVRRQAALAVGRIGDPAGVRLLVPLLEDSVLTVRVGAVFALGLLRDTAAVQPIIARLTSPPALDPATGAEAITALARIGGPRAAAFLDGVLTRREQLVVTETRDMVARAVLESWRLGRLAPVPSLVPFLRDTTEDLRWRAVYALGRLRGAAPLVKDQLPVALSDGNAFVRANAARGLTRAFADSAGLAPATVADLLARALTDAEPQVRINALRSLGGFKREADVARVAPLVDDANPGVAVQAVETLGDLGGADAATQLARIMADKKSFAMRRAALMGLARVDTAAFRTAAAPWAGSRDWRERAVVAEAAGSRMPGSGAEAFLRDADGRVAAAALQGWLSAGEGQASALAAQARGLLGHPDAMVRANAASALAKAPDAADVPALAAAFARARTDSIPDASLNALEALGAIAKSSPEGKARATSGFLATTPRPEDYLLRRWAEENWPEAADRWGAAYPIRTGRTLADYREIVRRFVLPTSPDRRRHVFVEIDQKGTAEIELFGDDAPLTVASFLALADQRYFDGLRFHRVVPNFVVQDGDPRGDGNGGPGYAIRDEINPNRYESPVIGMALSGPDTGGSQWFVNLSPQPHLDGTYAVFGRVVGGQGVLLRVLQGDVIRTIRR